MAERNFTDGDVKALGKEIASAIRGGGGGGGGSGGGGGGGNSTAPSKEATNTFNSMMKDSADAANKVTAAYNKVAPGIETGLNTWRDLSKVGAGFSNDIVGMTAAAAGTRMPLGEFAGVIKENAANLSGFGGNVTRGAEEFSRLSKRMFDDYAPNTDQLRQMGLTNKDLNELLMIQSVSTRSKMKDGDEKDKKLIENAMALGTEMDLMAKLTGKSREAQMEQQRKNQQDMAFEAAIRRKTIGMSADEAMEFEKNARNQLRDAQLRGQEAVFKDVFSTGTIKSKEAAAQASINQEQASATMKQAQVSADKTMDAKERERQANVAAAEGRRAFDKDMQNDTKLMYASLGEQGGTVGKVMRDSMGANIEYQRNLEATATKMGIVMKTDEDRAKVQKQMEEDAKSAAAGKKADGTQGDATTKALVNLGARAGDVESAFMNKIVKPLNEQVNPAFNKLAEGALGATKKGATETRVNAAERELDEGAAGKTTTGLNKLSGARVETGNIVNQLAGVKTQPKPIPEKALGGPVEEGEPYIVGDGGEEELFVPKTAGDIIPKSMLAPKGLGSRSNNKLGGGLNLNEISKDISTTVSGGGSSTVKGPDMAEMSTSMAKMGMKDDQKKIFDEMMSMSAQQSKEKLQSLIEEKASAQATNLESARARDAIEERLEAEGKSIKDLSGEDKKRFDELTKQMNSSYDAQGKINDAIKAAERAEQNKLSLQKLGYDTTIKQEEDKVKIVEASSEKIKSDIVDALPIKDIANKVDEAKTVLSDHQKTVLKYAYEDAEGKEMQLDNQKNRIKGELNSIAEKNKQIEDIQNEADGRELTQREQNRIERLQKEIVGGQESLKIREEELFVYQNLDKLKAESAEKTASILDGIAGPDVFAGAEKKKEEEFKKIREEQGAQAEDEARQKVVRSGAMQEVVTGSSPAKLDRGITTDSFTLGPNGLPIAKPKSIAAAVPDKPAEKKASPGKAINPETGEEYTPLSELEKQSASKKDATPKSGGESKTATLDDVVKSLNALNTKMGQLISTTESGSRDVAKAAKSNNANLYTR